VFTAVEPRLKDRVLKAGLCSLCEEVSALFLFKCRHKFCYDCSYQWVKECTSSADPKCIEKTCTHPIHINDIQLILPTDEYNRYLGFLLRWTLASLPDFQWCPNCPSGAFMEPQIDISNCGALTCPDCMYTWCPKCRCFIHKGLTCEEAKIKQSIEDTQNFEWKSQNSKQCPACSVYIQKSAGCSHMRCFHCKYEFCWICLGKFQPGRYTTNNICPCKK